MHPSRYHHTFASLTTTLALLFFIAHPLQPTCAATITTRGKVVVTDYTLGPANLDHGGQLLRLHLDNQSANAQQIRLKSSSYNDIDVLSTAITLQPHAQVLVSLPIPVGFKHSCNSFEILDGTQYKKNINVMGGHYYDTQRALYATPATQPHRFVEASTHTNRFRRAHPSYARAAEDAYALKLPSQFPDPWPSDFRAYQHYAACILTQEEFGALPAATQTALYDYAAAGGVLCLFATTTPTQAPFQFPLSISQGKDFTALPMGFGTLLTLSAASTESLSEETLLEILKTFDQTASRVSPDAFSLGIYSNAKDTPPPTETGGVFITLVLFSILAGPVLLTVLARRNQRIQILWMLPTLSFLFCATIATIFLLTNGIIPTVSIDTLTFLDQRHGRCLTAAANTICSPATLSQPIEVDRNALLAFHHKHSSRDASPPLSIDSAIRISRKVVNPGIPFQYLTRTLSTTHRRLVLDESHTEGISVQNLLGAPIQFLEIWSSRGERHTLTDLAPGATAVARPANVHAQDVSTKDAFNPFGPENNPNFPLAFKHSHNLYRATLVTPSSSPFLSNPLGSQKAHMDVTTVVYGLYEGSAYAN